MVLGIEPSCGETGSGPVRDGVLLGQASAGDLGGHARYGGVVPETSARAHLVVHATPTPLARTAA